MYAVVVVVRFGVIHHAAAHVSNEYGVVLWMSLENGLV